MYNHSNRERTSVSDTSDQQGFNHELLRPQAIPYRSNRYQNQEPANFSQADPSRSFSHNPPSSPSSTLNIGSGYEQSPPYSNDNGRSSPLLQEHAPLPPGPVEYNPYPGDYREPNYVNASYASVGLNPTISPRTSPSIPVPHGPAPPSNFSRLTEEGSRQLGQEFQSPFYEAHSTGYRGNPQFSYVTTQMQQPVPVPQPPLHRYPHVQIHQNQEQQQQQQHHQYQPQHHLHHQQQQQQNQHEHLYQQQQNQHEHLYQQQHASRPMQASVPFMMAGLQQMTGGSAGVALNHAAFGAQILQTLAPGAAGYTNQILGDGHEKVKSFMRMPKYYFAVNHRYVLRKLILILMPFMNRTWGRQRGLGQDNSDGTSNGDGTCYLPPRDDVNAPDLYIPVMAFVTYVLVVGFVFGTRNAFKAEVLANYFSRGLGVLTMEVLIIKLLLYLINARPTPWLDVIAYRGYKFVGVVLTIVLGLLVPRLYVPALLYSATAMGIFLMRSHRRIILPRDMEQHESHELARRNAFLLFVCVLQYPIYWILARVLYVKTV